MTAFIDGLPGRAEKLVDLVIDAGFGECEGLGTLISDVREKLNFEVDLKEIAAIKRLVEAAQARRENTFEELDAALVPILEKYAAIGAALEIETLSDKLPPPTQNHHSPSPMTWAAKHSAVLSFGGNSWRATITELDLFGEGGTAQAALGNLDKKYQAMVVAFQNVRHGSKGPNSSSHEHPID